MFTLRGGLLAVLLALTGSVCGQGKLATADLPGTLRALRDKLVEIHPFAGSPQGKVLVDSTLEVLLWRTGGYERATGKKPPDSLLLADVIELAAPLQRVTRCGHLQLSPKLSKSQRRALAARPYSLWSFPLDDSTYLLLDSLVVGRDTFPPGSELLGVDGRRMPALVRQLSAFGGLNDEGYERAALALAARQLPFRYQKDFGPRDSISVLVRDSANAEPVAGFTYPKVRARKRGKLTRTQRRERILNLTPASGDSAWVLDVNSFSGRDYKRVNYRRTLKRMFAELGEAGVERLVIDLRSNGGGSLDRMTRLYSYVSPEAFSIVSEMRAYNKRSTGKDPFSKIGYYVIGNVRREDDHYVMRSSAKLRKPQSDDLRFDGELVVLVNEFTFSAAAMFAHFVQSSGRGKLVGRPSGGSRRVVYGGQILNYDIGPHDELQLRAPNWELRLANPAAGTVSPDVLVPVTRASFVSEDDEALNAAQRLLGAGELELQAVPEVTE